jgi:hypothetical protein
MTIKSNVHGPNAGAGQLVVEFGNFASLAHERWHRTYPDQVFLPSIDAVSQDEGEISIRAHWLLYNLI